MEQAEDGREGGLLLTLLIEANLPKTFSEVEGSKILGAGQSGENVLDAGERIDANFGDFV